MNNDRRAAISHARRRFIKRDAFLELVASLRKPAEVEHRGTQGTVGEGSVQRFRSLLGEFDKPLGKSLRPY